MKVTSSEFKNAVGRMQDVAMREPVEISKNGRPHTVLVSADLFAVLTRGRIVQRAEDLTDDQVSAIAATEVPPQFAYLDKLLD